VIRLIAAAAALSALLACAGEADVTGDRRVNGPMTVVFTVRPARVDVGKSVRLTLRMQNNSGRNVDLTFNSGQSYDFAITKGSKELWRWSDERSFTQEITTRSVEPFGTVTFAESWTTEGAGDFVAHGEIKAQGYEHVMNGKLKVGG
jgi:hypothetical protein